MKRCLSLQFIPDFFIALLYLNPVDPAYLPITPAKIGAVAVFGSPSNAWQAEQCVSNTALPAPASPSGTSI